MAKMPASTTITCPACSDGITVPIAADARALTVAFDTSAVRAHVADHLAADDPAPTTDGDQ